MFSVVVGEKVFLLDPHLFENHQVVQHHEDEKPSVDHSIPQEESTSQQRIVPQTDEK
jgi:hypothetical protein